MLRKDHHLLHLWLHGLLHDANHRLRCTNLNPIRLSKHDTQHHDYDNYSRGDDDVYSLEFEGPRGG
jgi:hypothetical protein